MSSLLTPANPVPLPSSDPLTRPKEKFKGKTLEDVITYLKGQVSLGFITDLWGFYFSQQEQTLTAASTRINAVDLEDQAASIPATDMSGGALASGFYQVQFYGSPVIAGDGSSSLRVDLTFTDNGQTKTVTGTAIVGNSTGRVLYDVVPIYIDDNSPVTYAAVYAAGGGTPMKYDLRLRLVRVGT